MTPEEELAYFRDCRARMIRRLQEPDRGHEDALLGHKRARIRLAELDELIAHRENTPTGTCPVCQGVLDSPHATCWACIQEGIR